MSRISRFQAEPAAASFGPPGVGHPIEPGASTNRLGLALLVYLAGITLIVTLVPFQFGRPERWRVLTTPSAFDFLANVLLFFPLGFLYRLCSCNPGQSTLRVLAVGGLASLGIEAAQLFEVARYAAVPDVLANACGAWIGALGCDAAGRRLTAPHAVVGRLSLELPLMGLVYLLIPLLWLHSLSTGGDNGHASLSVALATFGAAVMSGIHRHHFGPRRQVAASTTAAAFVVWFVAGVFPLLRDRIWMVASGAAIGAGIICFRGRKPIDFGETDRRYEASVLLSSVPAYGAYLVLLCVLPLFGGVTPWHGGLGFGGLSGTTGRVEILRLLELVAACTLAGYMCAEFRGRDLTTLASGWRRLLRLALATAVIIEAVLGFAPGHGASLARGIFVVAASVFGAQLYFLQRAHVLTLLATAPASPPNALALGRSGQQALS
jgi:glycopeptide antibiotics resistance protein